MNIETLNKLLGNIDIYLLDHLLKNNYHLQDKILDAGCGEGRNMIYFLKNGYDVSGIDKNPDAIKMLHYVARTCNSAVDINKFMLGELEDLPYKSHSFHHVICSAVLHFAKNEEAFVRQFSELVRVLKPGGTLFIRTAASRGIEKLSKQLSSGQHALPDGSIRFLLRDKLLEQLIAENSLAFKEIPKYVVVDNQRCMSALLLTKLA